MPRLPGRESTQVQYTIDQIEITSFLLGHEFERFARKRCCIVGCEHPMQNPVNKVVETGKGSCDDSNHPSMATVKGDTMKHAGAVCPHHTGEALGTGTGAVP